jgi:hypothetical protein
MLTVRDLMTTDVATLDPDLTLREHRSAEQHEGRIDRHADHEPDYPQPQSLAHERGSDQSEVRHGESDDHASDGHRHDRLEERPSRLAEGKIRNATPNGKSQTSTP